MLEELPMYSIFPKEILDLTLELFAPRSVLDVGCGTERERSFYGDVDFIPQEQYTEEQARQALADAAFSVEQAEAALGASK